MKNMKRTLMGLLMGVALAIGLTGCDKDPLTSFKPDGTYTLSTNRTTGAISIHTNGVYELSQPVQSGLGTAQMAAPMIPPPYGTIVTGSLAAISSILVFWVKRKNNQLNTVGQALNAASTMANLVKPIIAGVEAVNDKSTKQAIQVAAGAAGVQGDLHSVVQTVTQDLPNAKFSASPIPS